MRTDGMSEEEKPGDIIKSPGFSFLVMCPQWMRFIALSLRVRRDALVR